MAKNGKKRQKGKISQYQSIFVKDYSSILVNFRHPFRHFDAKFFAIVLPPWQTISSKRRRRKRMSDDRQTSTKTNDKIDKRGKESGRRHAQRARLTQNKTKPKIGDATNKPWCANHNPSYPLKKSSSDSSGSDPSPSPPRTMPTKKTNVGVRPNAMQSHRTGDEKTLADNQKPLTHKPPTHFLAYPVLPIFAIWVMGHFRAKLVTMSIEEICSGGCRATLVRLCPHKSITT